MTRLSRIVFFSLLFAALCGGAVYAAFQLQPSPAPPPTLAGFVPPGALLAIESPDFAALLKSWNDSPEQKRWLAGDDYAGFSRSRLFGRLGDAQTEFAGATGLSPSSSFLQQVAGRQSIFAWYDINNLEFLYITRLPAGQAAATPLLQLRNQFEERKAGDATFYVKTGVDVTTGVDPSGGPARTVAFAVRGDYLLLATREDLLADALALMQQPGDRTLQHEPWYAATVAAASQQPGDLRMTLNLAKLVPMPFFRSYWVQQNITELKQYSAALSDLYCSPDNFREERVLLPAGPARQATAADLSPVLDYLPAHRGVYRALAQPSTDDVLAQLEDKLLSRQVGGSERASIAPAADLSTPAAGDASNLEQRIDAPIVLAQPRTAALTQLRNLLAASAPNAMLAFSTGSSQNEGLGEGVFAPVHTAVVLSAGRPWDVAALEQSLTAALAPRLSIGVAGLAWSEHHNDTASWQEMNGLKGLALFVRGNVCVLASDEPTLLQLLASTAGSPRTPRVATVIAGFDHTTERDPLLHLAGVLDHTTQEAQPGNGSVPPFFSGNMASLSGTFQDLAAETFTEAPAAGHTIRQTVLYQWRR